MKVKGILVLILMAGFLVSLGSIYTSAALASSFTKGDVFVAVSGGQYQHYDGAGNLLETFSDGLGGYTTGCACDSGGDLYTTNFTNTKVVVYDDIHPHPIIQVINTGAVNPGGHSESIVFGANWDFYVGHPNGNDDIQRYNAAGVYQQSYDVAIESRGSDWMDLAVDQCTMFYTSEGGRIMRYDVCSDAQLADFANIGGVSYALRLLPPGDGTGGLIVANTYDIKRLDGTGAVIQTYDAAGENCWFSMNLDPNGTSFWAGDYCSSNFYKFNIATGAIELGPINTGTGSYTLWGICIFGEPVAGAPPVGVPICNVFLTPDKLNVKRDPEHSFKVHVYPCEPMDVSVGDTAEVYVDVDDDGNFDEDYFLAIVSSTDVDGEATDIAVKVYDVSPLVAEIDPHVAIYSINNIAIVDTLGNPIDYLKLNTFSPGKFTTESALPEQVTLRQNHPNPFNPTTSIAFNLPFSTNWTLKIYNVAGQLVKGFEGFSAGWVTVNWAGTDHSGDKVSSGIYFYKLVAGDFTATKKMVLTK